MSRRTEASYLHYIVDFIRFHGKRHPQELGVGEIRASLVSSCPHPGAHLALVDLIAAPGGLLGRVARLLLRHASSPMSRRTETRLSLFYPTCAGGDLPPVDPVVESPRSPPSQQRSAKQCGPTRGSLQR